MKSTRRAAIVVIAAPLLVIACGRDARNEHADSPAASPTNEAIVLLNSGFAGAWPTGLDPATSTTSTANLSQMNAIYGGLFQLMAEADGSDPRIVGVLASGHEMTDEGRTLLIELRPGVVFSDGTPLDAEAVKFNIERALASPCVCAPTGWPWADVPVTTLDDRIVALHFRQPYPVAINVFPTTNINWIVSPAALRELGEEQFRITPVGAGPFRVVSNRLSSRLVVERNPLYWQNGRPYLDRIVFQSIGTEHAGLLALLAGDAHIYEGLTATDLVALAERNEALTVTRLPPTSPYVIQLNVSRSPFKDRRAREAIYYATNVEAIREGLFNGWYPRAQTFTAPGGLFHRETIPGYREYDAERAIELVKELGGLEVTLGTLRSPMSESIITALQSQWQEVGIEVTLEIHELATLVEAFSSEQWQAMLQTAGSFDPEAVSGVSSRFRSGRPFSGVDDAELDRLLAEAAGAVDPIERDSLYLKIGQHISDNAYGPFLLGYAPTQIAARGLEGPGLTTKIPPILVNSAIWWQDVRFTAE